MTSEPKQSQWIESRPTSGFRALDLRELWRYRELAIFLALRDLKVRYKQAAFGAAWAIFQPLAGVAVFTIVFRRLAGMPSDNIPYPVFAYVGLGVWAYLSSSVMKATQSLVSNSALVSKVYFPRLLAPAAAVLPGLIDLFLTLLLLVVLIPAYGVRPTWALLTLPLWVVFLVTVAFGIGLWLGALNVTYRDVNHGITLLVQLWLFASPVAYPSSQVPEGLKTFYGLNPMSGVIEGFRWALLGAPWPGDVILPSLVVTVVALVLGITYFQKTERRFADVI